MGCNCKNKTNTVTKPIPVIQETDGAITLVNQEAPPYTWEEVIAVTDFLDSRNKTEDGRQTLVDFTHKYFGEVIVGYVDQAIANKTRERLARCRELLNQYEQSKK
jgi:hypothetical protein